MQNESEISNFCRAINYTNKICDKPIIACEQDVLRTGMVPLVTITIVTETTMNAPRRLVIGGSRYQPVKSIRWRARGHSYVRSVTLMAILQKCHTSATTLIAGDNFLKRSEKVSLRQKVCINTTSAFPGSNSVLPSVSLEISDKEVSSHFRPYFVCFAIRRFHLGLLIIASTPRLRSSTGCVFSFAFLWWCSTLQLLPFSSLRFGFLSVSSPLQQAMYKNGHTSHRYFTVM